MIQATCGPCVYFHRNKMQDGAEDMDNGECRHSPPSMMVEPTPHGLALVTRYPMIPRTFLACGQFESRVGCERLSEMIVKG